MTNEEILEGNKLIAEFMGAYIDINGDCDFDRVYDDVSHLGLCYSPGKLKYNSSWDWLMPVVEKIEELGYYVKIGSKYCSIFKEDFPTVISEYRNSKIEKTYDIVISFIKYVKK